MAALEKMLEDLITPNAIPGLSLATLRAGKLNAAHAIGIRGAHDPSPVDAQTVFEAASLTKPNIVREEAPLMTYFAPGERFSYGSSAFAWLQHAMQTVTGMSLEALARQRVFEPFGMHASSLEWQERFAANHAQGHDWKNEPVPKRRVETAQAAWSLLTTASDYIVFLQAVLHEQGLSPQMYARWFAPTVHARQGEDVEDLFGVHPPDENVAWGLGWGLEPPSIASSNGDTVRAFAPTSSATGPPKTLWCGSPTPPAACGWRTPSFLRPFPAITPACGG